MSSAPDILQEWGDLTAGVANMFVGRQLKGAQGCGNRPLRSRHLAIAWRSRHNRVVGLYDISARTIDGRTESLSGYRGKTLLIVNVASQCGYTPQYTGLEALYRDFKDRGFIVLGFPCNQFGSQEPGSDADIVSFCSTTYNVTFPMFAKVDVNGPAAHPLFRHLKSSRKGLLGTESIKWNFTKFLVDRNGNVVRRYGPGDTPESIRADLIGLLDPA
jgi:glutathione peroxidase